MVIKKRPAPAYQEYASDVLANKNYRLMTLSERGLWDTMRKECWVNGSVPSDPAGLSKYLGLNSAEVQPCLTTHVLRFFEVVGDSFICPELENYRDELKTRSQSQSAGGARGGKATQEKNKKAQAKLQANLKPLRGGEMDGADMNRDELSEEELFVNRVNDEIDVALLEAEDEGGVPY